MLRRKTNLLLELFLEFHERPSIFLFTFFTSLIIHRAYNYMPAMPGGLTSGANLFVATGSIDCHIMCMHTNLPCVLAPLANAHSPTNTSFIVFETIVHSIAYGANYRTTCVPALKAPSVSVSWVQFRYHHKPHSVLYKTRKGPTHYRFSI